MREVRYDIRSFGPSSSGDECSISWDVQVVDRLFFLGNIRTSVLDLLV